MLHVGSFWWRLFQLNRCLMFKFYHASIRFSDLGCTWFKMLENSLWKMHVSLFNMYAWWPFFFLVHNKHLDECFWRRDHLNEESMVFVVWHEDLAIVQLRWSLDVLGNSAHKSMEEANLGAKRERTRWLSTCLAVLPPFQIWRKRLWSSTTHIPYSIDILGSTVQ